MRLGLVSRGAVVEALKKELSGKKAALLDLNLQALDAGQQAAVGVRRGQQPDSRTAKTRTATSGVAVRVFNQTSPTFPTRLPIASVPGSAPPCTALRTGTLM